VRIPGNIGPWLSRGGSRAGFALSLEARRRYLSAVPRARPAVRARPSRGAVVFKRFAT